MYSREISFFASIPEGRIVWQHPYKAKSSETVMEQLKDVQELLQPDFRSESFVKFDRTTGTTERMTIEDNHQHAALVQLHDGVPENVRSYMEAVKNLFVYGWLHYPFHTLAAFLATTAVEMALRERFPRPEPDRRGLGKLISEARRAGLLVRDEDFPSLARWREHCAEMLAFASQVSGQPVQPSNESYAEYVCKSLVKMRNTFAHPRNHWIMPTGPAIDMIYSAAEVINLLFPRPADQIEGGIHS